MATKKNLRYCKVKHGNTLYHIMLAVNSLDEVNDILAEWAEEVLGAGIILNLPEALLLNQDITELSQLPKVNSFVYLETP